MKRLNVLVLGATFIGAASIFAPLAQAQSGPVSPDNFQYRCRSFGDAAACRMLEAPSASAVVPGPYAMYLINQGVDREKALAAAAQIGERPTRHRAFGDN